MADEPKKAEDDIESLNKEINIDEVTAEDLEGAAGGAVVVSTNPREPVPGDTLPRDTDTSCSGCHGIYDP